MLEPVRESFRTGQADPMDARARPAGLCLFQSQHSREQGRGLRNLPWPGGQDAADVPANSLQMEWCLDCHRHPEQHVRPRSEVFTMGYEPKEDQETMGRRLVAEYKIQDAVR